MTTPGTFMPFTPSATGAQPYQLTLESFGAAGNGKIVGDAAITSGQPTLTSATAGFAAGDVGKYVVVSGAASGNFSLFTTISGFNSATSVTLAANAGATVTGASMLFGSDDFPAIKAAALQMQVYMQASQKVQCLLGNKIYCCGTGPYQTGNGSSTPTYNSFFPMLFPSSNIGRSFIPEVIGVGDASQLQWFGGTTPSIQGSVIAVMFNPATSGTFGQPSVIGGPTGSAGFTNGFANVKPFIQGVTVLTPIIGSTIGYDFRFCAGMTMNMWSAQVIDSVAGDLTGIPLGNLKGLASFQSATAVALWAPLATNNDQCYAGTGAADGYPTLFRVSEHFTWNRLAGLYCNFGMFCDLTGGTVIHGASGTNLSIEQCNTILTNNGGGGSQFPVNIGLLDVEVIATADVSDSSNVFTGLVHWADFGRTTPTITGAANLKVINDRLGPGHTSSPPAVPATTVAAALVYRDAMVKITTGVGVTVSAVTVDGTATGQTMAASSTLYPVRVPSGKTIALTYAGGTPTWDWWLD